MAESADLVTKLEASGPDVQAYVKALKAENAKLHKRIFQLEAENVSLENRIDVLQTENEKKSKQPFITISRSVDPTEEDLIVKMKALGYRVEKIA